MGLLENKFDKLLIFAAISTRCDEAMAESIQHGDPEAIVWYYNGCEAWIDFALTRIIKMCTGELESEKWRELAKCPRDFNKALDKMIRGVSTAMKLLYRIPDHRPSENEERNKSLFELKRKHPDWSFGELAIHYRSSHPDDRITDKHAERCYKQHEQRLALKMKRVLNSRDVHLQAKSLSEEELRNELPSPEYILDILTGATE